MTDHKYVAFDVHKATISVAVLNLAGNLVTQAVIQTQASAIRDFLRGVSAVLSTSLLKKARNLSGSLIWLARSSPRPWFAMPGIPATYQTRAVRLTHSGSLSTSEQGC